MTKTLTPDEVIINDAYSRNRVADIYATDVEYLIEEGQCGRDTAINYIYMCVVHGWDVAKHCKGIVASSCIGSSGGDCE